MRTFSVGFNDYWYTTSLYFDEVLAPLYYLKQITEFVCGIIPSIPLPAIPIKLKNQRDYEWTDNNDGWTNLSDWYGDIQQLFHLYICIPIHDFVQKYTKSIVIDMPYNFLKERFPESSINIESEYTDEEDIEFRIKTKKLANKADHEFKSVYNQLSFKYKKAYLRK